MPCPLCDAHTEARRRRWSRTVEFAGRTFEYQQCPSCRSLFCAPMPDPDLVARMYDDSYTGDPSAEQEGYDEWVLRRLEQLPTGRFLDFGCGQGRLLQRVAAAGWDVAGVEYDPEVARAVGARLGVRVATPGSLHEIEPVDVLHLGDVLEHLTDLADELPMILQLLAPGGTMLAQGPLEANLNLFTIAVRALAVARPGTSTMPPYHVTMATSRGQRTLFTRHGLTEQRFDVVEEPWPAPAVRPRPAEDPWRFSLWAIRRLSMAATRLGAGRGNRYRYVGTTRSA